MYNSNVRLKDFFLYFFEVRFKKYAIMILPCRKDIISHCYATFFCHKLDALYFFKAKSTGNCKLVEECISGHTRGKKILKIIRELCSLLNVSAL